ncbi:MAG: hypothetical protein P8Y70_09890 [Candidatus Lokiarchaeota archaeon]
MLHHYLKECEVQGKKIQFTTTVASSLMFEGLAEKFDARIIRTPYGECYVAEMLIKLLDKNDENEALIFGGEGSCGGIMFPKFNNARDGILAAAKIIEILVTTKKKISELVEQLPKYATYRINLDIKNRDVEQIISNVKEELIAEGEKVSQVGLDLRFGEGSEWFVLIHPSTTEPKLRIISEAKRQALAKLYCESTLELINFLETKIK